MSGHVGVIRLGRAMSSQRKQTISTGSPYYYISLHATAQQLFSCDKFYRFENSWPSGQLLGRLLFDLPSQFVVAEIKAFETLGVSHFGYDLADSVAFGIELLQSGQSVE